MRREGGRKTRLRVREEKTNRRQRRCFNGMMVFLILRKSGTLFYARHFTVLLIILLLTLRLTADCRLYYEQLYKCSFPFFS